MFRIHVEPHVMPTLFFSNLVELQQFVVNVQTNFEERPCGERS